MHILQIIPALDEGGVERGVIELNRALVAAGDTSTVISRGGRLVATLTADGGRHIALDVKSKNPLTFLSRAFALRRVLQTVKPDVIHFRSRVPGWLVRIANRATRIPVVSTVHGLNSVSAYSRIMTTGDRVICPSTAVANYIKQHYATPDEKIRIIFRGIDAGTFDPATCDRAFMMAFRKQFALSDDAFIVLAVGRITQLKGYDMLIHATARLKESLPQLRTVIVGGAEAARADYAEALHALARTEGVEDRVIFAGPQRHVAELYALANVLVSANYRKPEAFGRSMAEALAMNCPVVATRFGGACDIISDGFNGVFIDPVADDVPDAHMRRVTALADAISRAAVLPRVNWRDDVMTRFSLANMIDQTRAVYREVVQTCGQAAEGDTLR